MSMAERTCSEVGALGGRPTSLTEDVAARICDLIEETACSLYTAGLSLDLNPSSLYNWEEWGRAGRQPYRAFLEAVMQARARAEIALVREMRADSSRGREGSGGRVEQWLLERRFAQDYDNRFKYDKHLADLSPEELDGYIDTCDAVFGGEGEAIEGEQACLPASGDESGVGE